MTRRTREPSSPSTNGLWSTRARELARTAAEPVVDLARTHTTVSVERATLRLAGLAGADADAHPVGQPPRRRRPRRRSASSTACACRSGTPWSATRPATCSLLAQKAAVGSVSFRIPEGTGGPDRASGAAPAVATGLRRIDRQPAPSASASSSGSATRRGGPGSTSSWPPATSTRTSRRPRPRPGPGADVIAVIRSTGQRLLDYVPEGATREGYAGTYATQENFRLMRAALDDVGARAGPLRAADQLRQRAVHARDRRRWPGSSGST